MKTVIEMAREAGLVGGPVYARGLDRFAELVRADAIADEREACAMVCMIEIGGMGDGYDCAAAIRARSKT